MKIEPTDDDRAEARFLVERVNALVPGGVKTDHGAVCSAEGCGKRASGEYALNEDATVFKVLCNVCLEEMWAYEIAAQRRSLENILKQTAIDCEAIECTKKGRGG